MQTLKQAEKELMDKLISEFLALKAQELDEIDIFRWLNKVKTEFIKLYIKYKT